MQKNKNKTYSAEFKAAAARRYKVGLRYEAQQKWHKFIALFFIKVAHFYKNQFKIGYAKRREAHQTLAMRFLTSAASYKLKISTSCRMDGNYLKHNEFTQKW